MPFITNKERQKTIKKINRGNRGRKAFIIINLFLWLALVVMFLVAAILEGKNPDKYWFFNWNNMPYYYDGSDVPHWHLPESCKISLYGLIMTIVLCWLVFSNILSTIFIFTFESAKTITGKVNKLASSALSGKKKSDSSYSDVKKRIGK